MTNDQYIITTLLRAERDAAYEAIRQIWNASQERPTTEMQRSATIDQMIYLATELLPDEMRTPDMPNVGTKKTTEKMDAVRRRHREKSEPKNGLEDLF